MISKAHELISVSFSIKAPMLRFKATIHISRNSLQFDLRIFRKIKK